jgi:glycosyltransferase involved in cell wall biosynthesis
VRIVLDARTIQDHFPGIARYTFNLALALADSAPHDELLLLHHPAQLNTRYDMSRFGAKLNARLIEAPVRSFSTSAQWRIPALLRKLHADIYHSPYFIMPYRISVPAIVTIHDLIPMLYPAYFTAFQRLAFDVAIRLATRAVRRVVTVSEATAEDLRHLVHLTPNKVSVVHSAADPSLVRPDDAVIASVRARYNLPETYVLYVGSNKPHKNLIRLVEAWSQMPNRNRTKLVLAGNWDSRHNEARLAATRLGLESDIRWLGSTPQHDLAALYSGATLFVFPSEYEGFGLPVLEAMACGVPVLCSNSSSLPEVAGDAAVLLDPGDSDSWAEAIQRLLADEGLRMMYGERGLRRAGQFTWSETARQMREVYARTLELW